MAETTPAQRGGMTDGNDQAVSGTDQGGGPRVQVADTGGGTVRVQPRWYIGVAVFVAYLAIVSVIWAVVGFDYDSVAESTENVRNGIVVPIGVGAVFLAGVTTYLGWWGPVMREVPRTAPRWTLLVPVGILLIALAMALSVDPDQVSTGFLLTLAAGVLLVGFSEELLTRGLTLVGFRGQVSEGWAWFASSALFALLHGINLLFGQSFAATAQQMVFAFVLGSALYVARMATGYLAAAMLLHALWDFGAIGSEATDSANVVASLFIYPLGILALVAVFFVVRAKNAERVRQH
ncbi:MULTISPECIES: CPBP family intramembrane glutamic endopeptidase [unclassified Ornithinimicrobium]|uniref:CPBP family intramembrane glutamic endopeptidase n=1 Tax=unclassified Ornithinimicrobium TaxID=2615080 RepID=UPI003853E6C6